MQKVYTAIIEHDSTCEPGDEWMLHGMVDDKNGKPMVKEDVDNARIGCVVFCVILLVGGIGFGIWYLFTC